MPINVSLKAGRKTPDPVAEVDQAAKDCEAATTESAPEHVTDLIDVHADYQMIKAMRDEENLLSLLTTFLNLNEDPSDDEVHALAKALRLSKEAVEEVMYSMLADRLHGAEDVGEVGYGIDELPPITSAIAAADSELELDLSAAEEEDEDLVLDLEDETASTNIILNPSNTDEMLSNDGEPDPYIVEQRSKQLQ